MSPEVRDAIDAAREEPTNALTIHIRKPISFERAHYLILAFLRDIPEGLSVADVRDELEIASNQEPPI